MSQNILLVGAGALGSRHLQSLAGSADVAAVTVVEPHAAARETATGRWNEIAGSAGKILRFAELHSLSTEFDAAVVATPSFGRLAVLDTILKTGVTRILCEKVLFQTERDLDAAVSLAAQRGADVRVNHVYRYANAFMTLHDLQISYPLRLTVKIGGDGMGCNLIHYLDLLEYLSGATLVALDVSIDPPHAAKRGPAYLEFCGRATAVTSNGAKLDLSYVEGAANAPLITVESATGRIEIDEGSGTLTGELTGFAVQAFNTPRVSALTGRILEDQRTGHCRLPTLAQSAPANRLMLARFNQQIHGRHAPDLACPIT
jgi:predicted dehydrogenase